MREIIIKNNQNEKSNFLSISIISISLNSCKKNELLVEKTNMANFSKMMSSLPDDKLEILYKNFARAFSIVSKDAEVRNYILSKVKNQANGDYEVLYMDVKDKVFQTGLTFERLIIDASGNTLSTTVLSEDKLLSICMPVNIETVTPTVIPSVVYGDDEKALTISGFDANQREIKVDNKITPTVAYWVIRDNERYDSRGNLLPEVSAMLANISKVKIQSTFNPPSTASRFNNPLVGEYFESYEVPDLKKIESWAHGKPEIVVHVIGNVNNVGIDVKWFQLSSLSRNNYGVGKVILDKRFVCIWTTPIYGNYLQYFFLEKDKDKYADMSYTLNNMYAGGQSFNYIGTEGSWHPKDEFMGFNNINISDNFQVLTTATGEISYSCNDH